MQRESQYDVLKGMAILMMVAFHARAPFGIRHFGCLFHMAVFFILAGWFFDFEHSKSIGAVLRYIGKRLARLWLPMCLWGGVFILLHNKLIDWHVISDIGTDVPVPVGYLCRHWSGSDFIRQLLRLPLTLGDTSQLSGAFWFLQTLLIASCGYCISSWVLLRTKMNVQFAQTCISAVLLAMGRYCHLFPFAISEVGRIFTAYALIHIGTLLRHGDLRIERLAPPLRILIAVISFCALLTLSGLGSVALSSNKFPSCTFLILCSVSGWYFLLAVASFLKANGTLSYVGKHTLPIVFFHFLSFKAVSLLGILAFGDPVCRLSEHPVCYRGSAWWICYAFAGTLLPLAANQCYATIRNRVLHRAHGNHNLLCSGS